MVVAAAARLAEKPTGVLHLRRRIPQTMMEQQLVVVAAAAAGLGVRLVAGLLLAVELLPRGSSTEFEQTATD